MKRVLLVIVFLLGIGIACFVIERITRVSELEFSAAGVSQRTITYHAIPYWGARLGSQHIHVWRNELEEYLIAEKIVKVLEEDPTDWEFVHGSQWGVRGDKGDADWMVPILSSERSKEWLTWSKQFPDRARLLWPVVFAWAGKRRFLDASYLLEEMENPRESMASWESDLKKFMDNVDQLHDTNGR